MRANSLIRRRRNDRGAVLILVAVFVVVAVVMLAAVIDLGALRQEKREVTMSTDAAALAAVQSANFASITGPTDCGSALTTPETVLNDPTQVTVERVARDFLLENGGSTFLECWIVPDGLGSGYVTVTATEDVEYAFGKAVGQDSGSVGGTSSAAYTLDLGGGLRPIGVCKTSNSLDVPSLDFSTLLAPLAASGAIAPAGVPHFSITLSVEKLDGEDAECGIAPGHFGQIDFADDGNAKGTCDPSKPDKLIDGSYCEDLYNGWFGDLPADHVYSGNPGSEYPGTEQMFDNLRDEVGHFFVPVHDAVVKCAGSPKPTECDSVTGVPFRVSYYVEVTLDSYCLDSDANAACRIQRDDDGDGTIQNDEKFRWFKLDVYRVVEAAGLSTLPKTDDAEPIPARICATDEDVTYC